MIRQIFVVILLHVATVSLTAQDSKPVAKQKNKCLCGFQSLVQGGLIEGEIGPSWNLQTINGAYYKGWFTGVGLGLDYYMMRTIPLFLDIRKDLFNKRRTPFLYADAGMHFEWLKTKEKPGWGSSDYDMKFYYDLGLGYKLEIGNNDAILVSVGYSVKKLREERMIVLQCIQAPCNSSKDYYNYTFSRLSFKVGWQFR
jgi:hypothetical protein